MAVDITEYEVANITEEQAEVDLNLFLQFVKSLEKYGIDISEDKYVLHYNHEDDSKVIGFISNEDTTDKNVQVDIWRTEKMNVFSVWMDEYLVFDIYYDNEENLVDVRKYSY